MVNQMGKVKLAYGSGTSWTRRQINKASAGNLGEIAASIALLSQSGKLRLTVTDAGIRAQSQSDQARIIDQSLDLADSIRGNVEELEIVAPMTRDQVFSLLESIRTQDKTTLRESLIEHEMEILDAEGHGTGLPIAWTNLYKEIVADIAVSWYESKFEEYSYDRFSLLKTALRRGIGAAVLGGVAIFTYDWLTSNMLENAGEKLFYIYDSAESIFWGAVTGALLGVSTLLYRIVPTLAILASSTYRFGSDHELLIRLAEGEKIIINKKDPDFLRIVNVMNRVGSHNLSMWLELTHTWDRGVLRAVINETQPSGSQLIQALHHQSSRSALVVCLNSQEHTTRSEAIKRLEPDLTPGEMRCIVAFNTPDIVALLQRKDNAPVSILKEAFAKTPEQGVPRYNARRQAQEMSLHQRLFDKIGDRWTADELDQLLEEDHPRGQAVLGQVVAHPNTREASLKNLLLSPRHIYFQNKDSRNPYEQLYAKVHHLLTPDNLDSLCRLVGDTHHGSRIRMFLPATRAIMPQLIEHPQVTLTTLKGFLMLGSNATQIFNQEGMQRLYDKVEASLDADDLRTLCGEDQPNSRNPIGAPFLARVFENPRIDRSSILWVLNHKQFTHQHREVALTAAWSGLSTPEIEEIVTIEAEKYPYFRDLLSRVGKHPQASATAVAKVLSNVVDKSTRVVDKDAVYTTETVEDYDGYGYPTGSHEEQVEVTPAVVHYEYSNADLSKARSFLQGRPPAFQRQVLSALRQPNPGLAGKLAVS